MVKTIINNDNLYLLSKSNTKNLVSKLIAKKNLNLYYVILG